MSIDIAITPDMKATFASETSAHLDQFEQMLLTLETDPRDTDAIHGAFRAVHSIKGNSDYLGIGDINALAHALETLMDDLRQGNRAMAAETISVLFAGQDVLRDMNRHVTQEDYQERDIQELLQKIGNVHILPTSSPPDAPADEIDVHAVFANIATQHLQYLARLANDALAGQASAAAGDNARRILDTFAISAGYAGHTAMANDISQLHRQLGRAAKLDAAAAQDLKKLVDRLTAQIPPATMAAETDRRDSDLSESVSADVLGQDLTLSVQHADALMHQVAELVIAAHGLNHALTQIPAAGESLKTGVMAVNRVCRDLQALTQQIRLVRLEALFSRLPRIVRDLSQKIGKKIQIVTLGADTEIDRKVIEKLVDPMIHLIRNAIDHGIEMPAERIAQGKPDRGVITVKARTEGHFVLIDMIDDGRGIDPETIRRAALSKKLMDHDTLAAMSPEAIINLIFRPGYSSVTEQTTVSGRGVGLDIVRSNLKTIGGNVTLASELGQATRFRLHVPISMTVVDVLTVTTGDETYAVPMTGVVETCNVRAQDIQVTNALETMVYDQTAIGVAALDSLLDLTPYQPVRKRLSQSRRHAVIIAHGGNHRALVVDRIVGRESIIVKPLDRPLADSDTFAGAALMGDGSILLVLNPGALV